MSRIGSEPEYPYCAALETFAGGPPEGPWGPVRSENAVIVLPDQDDRPQECARVVERSRVSDTRRGREIPLHVVADHPLD